MLEARLADFRRAAEALVDTDVISAARDRDIHALVRRHAQQLESWFGSRLGWGLVEHPEFSRLMKLPARPDPSMGATWAYSARDYELLAWVLWFGERHSGKFTISLLAEEIRNRSAEVGEGASFDWMRHEDRLRLRRVLEALERMSAVRVWDGSAHEWAEGEGKHDALCEWGALAWQIHVPFSSATVDELAAGTRASVPAPDRAPVPPRMRLYRALVLGPACIQRDDPEAFQLLDSIEERRKIAADLHDHLSRELEVTRSYARLLRCADKGEAVVAPIPILGSDAQVVLLLCGALRQLAKEGALVALGGDWFSAPGALIEIALSRLKDEYGPCWKKEYRIASTRKLMREVIPEMRRWGLIRGPNAEDAYEISPLVGRLSAYYLDMEGGGALPDDEGEAA